MTPKTTFGFTFKNNNVSKSTHIPNVFKKSLGMLKSERTPNVLKSQRISAVKGLDLKSVPTYLSHRLMEQIQPPMGAEPPMMVGCPQAEDIKIQLAQAEKVKQIQLTPMTKVKNTRLASLTNIENIKHLQTFTQIEETNIKHLGASPQSEEKVYPQTEVGRFPPMAEKSFTPMMEAPFTPLGKTSNHKFIAKLRRCHYPNRALSKILKLALVGYDKSAHIVRLGLFLCVIPLCVCIFMAKLEGEAFALASYLIYWSTNPFQLCHPYLVVNGNASVIKSGVHHCA